MRRFVLLAFLVTVVSSFLLDEDMKSLENLEDLLTRDKNIRQYTDNDEGRTPFGLWTQFNSARRSPMSRERLQMYLKMLQENESPFLRFLSNEDIQRHISQIRLILQRPEDQGCAAMSVYRTPDGSNNNMGKKRQGAADTRLKRVAGTAYDDGLSKPRTLSVVAGEKLPSARDVSRAAFDNLQRQNNDFTSLTMHFGQLTDHDLTAVHSPMVNCSDCSVEGECFCIPIHAADPVFGCKKDCFEFVRSSFEMDAAGVRQHVNSITTYLDASFVYGSDSATAWELADDAGFMEHGTDNVTGRPLLPPDTDHKMCAGENAATGIYCGKAGDDRAAEQPGLTSLHTLFLREHNRVAGRLRELDSSLSPRDVYQKARRIVGAEWQHILYNEYLPLIIGKDQYTSESLSPDAPYTYDPDVDASISNVFAAAAFRFGHTLVPFEINRVTRLYKTDGIAQINVNEAFFNATYMYDESVPDGAVDSILRGMTIQSSQVVDGHFSDALTDNLFGDPDEVGDGFDLTALNIQRARDHGIPSYTTLRSVCGFDDVTSFRQLTTRGIMRQQDVARLRAIYSNVRDVDAFVGLVLEKPLPNTLVGPILSCIFAEQFHRLKFGDRFFYLNGDQYTADEIQEIKKATMARLMCDNVEGVRRIQPYMFVKARNFAQHGTKRYDSFYEYSKSGTWPHKRAPVLDGLDNSRKSCAETAGEIPFVDISKFI